MIRVIRIAILLIFCQNIFGQSCLPSGITFTTQEAVDAFPTDYPGCKIIEGVLKIEGSEITHVDSLIQIIELGGLRVKDNDVITSLEGFGNLETVNGNFWIQLSDGLENLEGLENVHTVDQLLIQQNSHLQNIDAISGLSSCENGLFVLNNASLEHIYGFNEIPSLTNIQIRENLQLHSIIGFDGLDTIQANFRIEQNHNLATIDIAENLKFIGGDLEIVRSDELIDLSGFEQLDSIQMIRIITNGVDFDIPRFDSLRFIENLQINNNRGLKRIDGFDNLQKVLKNLMFTGNDSLITIKGFNELDSIIRNCDIDGNWAVENLDAYLNLEFIGGHLDFSGFKELEKINGFQNLNRVNGPFYLALFRKLIDINNFSSIEHIGGDLHLSGLRKIKNILSLDKLDYVQLDSITIGGCDSLSVCHSYPICKFLEENIGPCYINTNKEGCNTREEILTQCATNNTQNLESSIFKIYPNPSRDFLYIKSEENYQFTSFSIYNTLGILLEYDENTFDRIDISHLPAGMYTLILKVGDNRITKKFIKVD